MPIEYLKIGLDKIIFYVYVKYMESDPVVQKTSPLPTNVSVSAQKKQRQLIFALIFALLAVLLLIIVLANTRQRVDIIPQRDTSTKVSKEPKVSLKKEYKNPFDKNAQYVNPFSQYKNPFDNLIK